MAYANSLRNFSGRLTNNSSAGNYLTLPNEVAGAPQSLMPSQSTNSTQNAFSGGIGTGNSVLTFVVVSFG